MLILMLLPVAGAFVITPWVRRQLIPGETLAFRGAWLVPLGVGLKLTVDGLRSSGIPDEVLTRGAAIGMIAGALGFVLLNRHGHKVVRLGSASAATGAGLNALAMLLFGAMPVNGWAANVAGYESVGEHPSPGYVRSDDLGSAALWMGDFMPIPGFLKVLSIGDLFLFAGCVVLLACVFARLLTPAERSVTALRSGDTRGEVK